MNYNNAWNCFVQVTLKVKGRRNTDNTDKDEQIIEIITQHISSQEVIRTCPKCTSWCVVVLRRTLPL